MDITDIVSKEYVEFSAEKPVSKAIGAFDDPTVQAIVVTTDGSYDGVVTRRQLTSSHRPPQEKLGSLVWHVPRVSPTEDVREVAQLMLDSDSRVLPVFEGRQMEGVVTADDLIRAVEDALDALTVANVFSQNLVTVDPETTFGKALHVLRDEHITHLPVVEDDQVVGILSLYDVTELSARAIKRSQGGNAAAIDTGAGTEAQGGYGAREGELERILDLPVRDMMVSPVHTIEATATLDHAVAEMFDLEGSSLVVVNGQGTPRGIVTKTDVLDALTWEAEGNRAVQLYGADLMDDISYDAVVDMIDKFDDVDSEMNVIDAKIHLHEHDEMLRGTPLLLARIRLDTDRGLYIATGEGYGAKHAINEARDILERRIRDDKTYASTKKHPDAEYWEKRFGWWLEA